MGRHAVFTIVHLPSHTILFARAFRGCFFCNTDSMSATAPNYNHTVTACFVGYITQAVINNFMPLLFVTFAATLGIDMARLSALITVNFVTQLVVDVLAGKFVDRIGYKPCIIAAHLAALAGLLALGLLPTRVPDPYLAILAAIFLYALGGGLIEVMVSPIVEACPSEHKAKAMSLLHSFYCWGQLGTVAISTLFLFAFGTGSWPVLACLWAIVPAIGIAMFAGAPMPRIVPEGTATMRFADLSKKPVFYLMFLMMLCAGAAEQGMSQWASVRRVRSGRDQGDWRLGGTCRIRPDDGPVPHDLRSAGASTGSHGIHCQQFRTVRGHVSDRSPNHGTGTGSACLCAHRFFSGYYVARNVLDGCRRHARWRYADVRATSRGRRPRMRRRPCRSGTGGLCQWRQS